jgi:hypothetical protein|tara:strand:+ start:1133 stop:1468 length:336 start_codon:yes stop_codon:yes gene_type:complete
MKARSVKAKGRRLQNIVRDALRDAFPSLEQEDIKSQTMGMTGEDIVLSPIARKSIPYSIECKNQERLQIWKSLEQAESNTAKDCDPVLIIKRNGTKPYVVIDFHKFISLIK